MCSHDLAGEASIAWSTPCEGADPPEKGAPADPERAADSAVRRARITLRRYATSLQIDRLGTATFRCRRCDLPTGCVCPEGPDRPKWEDRDYVLACIEGFRRKVRAVFGEAVALAIVIEHHDDGHLHVHFGFGQFLDKSKLRTCWDHGFVDLRRIKTKDGRHIGKRERARRCAAYLTKYVTKEHHVAGVKSYSTTRGLVPAPRRERFMTRNEAVLWLCRENGGVWESEWSSADMETWEAPPVWLLFWGDPA